MAGELHASAGDSGSIWIDNCPVDGSRNSLIGQLIAGGGIFSRDVGLASLAANRGGGFLRAGENRKNTKQGHKG